MRRTILMAAFLSVASAPGFAHGFREVRERLLFSCSAGARFIWACAPDDDVAMLDLHAVGPKRSIDVAMEGQFSSRTVVVTGNALVPNGPSGTYVTLRHYRDAYTIYATGKRGGRYGDGAGLLIENDNGVVARYACDDGRRDFDNDVLSRLNAGRVIHGKDKTIPF